MTNFVVSEFSVQLGFDSTKALKGLESLDKKVLQAATRIEKQLNGAFTRLSGAQKTGDMFKQIQRQADNTSNHIQKALQRGFAVGGVGSGLFNRYQQEGVQAASTVRDAMRDASRAAGAPAGNPRPYTPRVNSRLSGADSIRDLSHRQTTSAFYGNMQLRTPETAASYLNRLNGLRDSHLNSGADVNAFRRNLRDLNFEFAQTSRAASQARAAQRLNAMEGTGAFSRLSVAATALAAGFLSVQRAVEYFGEALHEGARRQQVSTMLKTAYGDQSQVITAAVDQYANKYGADRLEARQQAAQLRMTMPKDIFSGTDIPKLLETESVFAHQTGMTQDAVGRLNYAMQQIATSTHLMGQDWLQVVNASPALIQQLLQLTGKKSVKDLKEFAKAMSGADFAKKMVKAMEQLNNKTNAAVAAQNSMMAVTGRYSNAVKDSQEQFFFGFSDGFKHMVTAATSLIGDNLPLFKALGNWLGSFFDKVAGWVYALDNVIMTLRAYYADFEDIWTGFFKSLPEPVQIALTKIGDTFKTWVEGMLVTAALFGGGAVAKKGGSWLMRLLGLGGGAATLAEGGAAAAAAGAPVLPVAGATLLTYLGLKSAGYDPAYVQQNEDGIPGVPAKDSRLNRFLDWAGGALNSVAGNYNTSMNAPLLNGVGASQSSINANVKVQVAPIQIAPITLNVPLPDGSQYTTTVDVNHLIQGHAESAMMSAQGLGGGWQVPGQNAGFSPSLLKR